MTYDTVWCPTYNAQRYDLDISVNQTITFVVLFTDPNSQILYYDSTTSAFLKIINKIIYNQQILFSDCRIEFAQWFFFSWEQRELFNSFSTCIYCTLELSIQESHSKIKQKYINFFFSIISLYSSPFDFYTLIFDPFVSNFSSLLLIFGCPKNWLHDDTYPTMLILDAFYFFISFHWHLILAIIHFNQGFFFRVLLCHWI